MTNKEFPSELLNYLVEFRRKNPDQNQLPSLIVLGNELGTSVARLREQLEVAKALGLVEVKPRTGIKLRPYTFTNAVWQSLSYAIHSDRHYFDVFADLRKHIELAYWHEAVSVLTQEDKSKLNELLSLAFKKLRGTPIMIPHEEHRELHLLIYLRLDNPFVIGILEAYWNSYEDVGLSVFTDLDYLEDVWDYHQKMVDAICSGDLDAGYQALSDHADLIRSRPALARD